MTTARRLLLSALLVASGVVAGVVLTGRLRQADEVRAQAPAPAPAVRSIAGAALPDFTGVSAKSHIEQTRMTQAIEKAIKTFEPRFINVKVSMEPLNNLDRMFKFRIEANLDIEPAPEPVVFDTVLQMGSGNFAVKEA